MKSKLILYVTILAAVNISACKKASKPTEALPDKTDLSLFFNNNVDGKPVRLDTFDFVNAAGNAYEVKVLKYYVSNIRLVNKNGDEIKFNNYELINEKEAASKTVLLKDVPLNEYTAIRFSLGVDGARNHTGVQDGDLDPSHDMIWDWNTGYVFFKHEGSFKTSGGSPKALIFHMATDEALTACEVPLGNLHLSADGKILSINFNLNSAYTSPVNIDFNTDNWHTSAGAGDAAWLNTMKSNMADAFSFGSYQ